MKRVSVRRMVKYLALAGMASVLCLTGCKKSDSHGLDPDNPVAVQVWNYYNGTQLRAFDNMVKEFNETEGRKLGIVVTAFSQGSIGQVIEAVRAAAAEEKGADELPDIFTGYADLVCELDEKGLIADLGGYFTEEELEEFYPSYLEEGCIGEGEKLKIFPTAKCTELLFINKTDWEKFADETGAEYEQLSTWEGLAQTAQAYYEWTDAKTPEPEDGKAFYGRDSYANYILIGCRQLGQEMFLVEDGKASLCLDETIMRRIWDNFYVPYINGYFTGQGRFRSDDAKTGDVIALVGSSTSTVYFPSEVIVSETESYPIEGKILPLPNFEGTSPVAVQQGAGMAVISSDSIREYASACFIKWFTEKQQNLDFAVKSSYLPVSRTANAPEVIEDYLTEQGDEIEELVAESIRAGIAQVNGYEMYAGKAFLGGNDARKILEKRLIEKAQADRELVAAEIENGRTRQEAVALFDTDENFEEWYRELGDELAVLFD